MTEKFACTLSAQNNNTWYVITDGPIKIEKVNATVALIDGAHQFIEKHL